MGPTIVSPDDFDFDNATITTTVNGEIRQQAKLQQMMFKPTRLSNLYLSLLHYRG
ncbi:MAG: fumarylacetoacetate hydrolase family protein [Veillonella sp.]